MAKIVLTDDHVLLRKGLSALIQSLGHTVLFEADNGNDFISKLKTGNFPDLVLLDINMPG
jgi:two-component system, NarL family, invasion response regulator UvrY